MCICLLQLTDVLILSSTANILQSLMEQCLTVPINTRCSQNDITEQSHVLLLLLL